MKVWFCGEWIDVEMGQRFFVGRCGSGLSCFGEFATLERADNSHLIFKTDSGATVKTQIDTLNTVGKAAKENYFVSPIIDHVDYIPENVRYWNSKKLCFEYK